MVLIAIISALAIYGISKINLDEILGKKRKYENIKLNKKGYFISTVYLLFFSLLTISFSWICIISKARYLSFPIKKYSFKWYEKSLESETIHDLLITSLKVASIVTIISVIIAFFGALAFARYNWRFRGTFQKLILLPIFFLKLC